MNAILRISFLAVAIVLLYFTEKSRAQPPNTWTQKANVGGAGRQNAVGFSIGSKGYLGTGNTDPTLVNDFWEYDPATNTWTQKAGFVGGPWDGAVGFSIGTKGYLGSGVSIISGTTNGFWEYNPGCSAPSPPVNTTPPAGLVVCSGNSATLTAGGTGTLGWYNGPVGGTWLGGGPGYTTPALTGNTTYYVQDSTCAASAARTAITVTVSASPAVFNVTGGGSYCAGGAGVAVGLSGSSVGISYTLFRGATAVSAMPGTGAPLNFGLQTIAGIYTVMAAYGAASCSGTMNGSALVTVLNSTVPTIGSTNTPCMGSSANIYYTESGMTGYAWSVSPGGVIASGQGTSVADITWNGVGIQWVSVTYTSVTSCPVSMPGVYNLFVNPPPNAAGAVAGTSLVCAGTGGVAYSCAGILNAASYTWTLPAGAAIATGAGTTNITVNYASNAFSGNITVAGNHSCGNGTSSPPFPVTVNQVPAAPVVTAAGNVLTSSSPAGNQWYYEGTAIAGANQQSYIVANHTGYYGCTVTLLGCTSSLSNKVWVVVTGEQEMQFSRINVYPVPNRGRFTLSIGSRVEETISMSIYNEIGVRIFGPCEIQVNGLTEKQIDISPAVSGTYTIVLFNKDQRVVRKMLISL
ncbi:MAG: T9SS type A sorting domain-containing protein [Bacteroidota bacterium]